MSNRDNWLRYIKDGYKLVPIKRGCKYPTYEGWTTLYVSDEVDLDQALSATGADCSFGVILGPSGLVSLDIDDYDAAKAILADRGIDIDVYKSLSKVISGNPSRFRTMFRAPAGVVLTRKAVKGTTGQVAFELRAGDVQDVLPPSIHPEHGEYRYLHDGELEELPQELLDLWLSLSTPVVKSTGTKTPNAVIQWYNENTDVEDLLVDFGYERVCEGRYRAPDATSKMGGVVVLPDNKVYSHHVSDPLADGKAHDAYDVLRILAYDGNQSQTYAKVCSLKQSASAPVPAQKQDGLDYSRLLVDKNGIVKANLENAISVIEMMSPTAYVYDEMAQLYMVTESTPWMVINQPRPVQDIDYDELALWMMRNVSTVYQTATARSLIVLAVEAVARKNKVHPVRDYLSSLSWDGVDRLRSWLSTYLGASDDYYTSQVGIKWMVAGVARAMQDGVKVDNILVLEGAQGVGKTTALQILGGDKYVSLTAGMDSKEAAIKVRGKWVVNFDEFAAITRAADVEHVKSFVTETHDEVRLPYARTTTRITRTCIFAATINPLQGVGYLKDATGNRRYWPVAVKDVDFAALQRDRDQLWAEAVVLYNAGTRWWVDRDDIEFQAEAKAQQEEREEVHPWQPLVQAYVDNGETRVGTSRFASGKSVDETTTADVLEAIGLGVKDVRFAHEARIVAKILSDLGFTQKRVGKDKTRKWVRGKLPF